MVFHFTSDFDLDTILVGCSLIVSIVSAIFSAILSWKVSKKSGQTLLNIELMLTSEGLYAVLSNVGNAYAYDVKINVSENFVNGFEYLTLIQPHYTYRYLLLSDTNQLSLYPEKVCFSIQYKDSYTRKQAKTYQNDFCLLDHLKYKMSYNQMFNSYDLSKF